MIKGIIFDMDGIILDSLSFFYGTFETMFWEEFAVKVTKKEFSDILGSKAEHGFENILKNRNLIGDGLELKKKWEAIAAKNPGIEEIPLMYGVAEALPVLHKHFGIALATGNVEPFTRHILKKLGVLKYFQHIMTADHVERAKPDPEIFLKAAEKLELLPSECVVIEDAILGVQAAKNAGMKVVSIQNEFTSYQDHSIADLQLETIRELTPSVIKELSD